MLRIQNLEVNSNIYINKIIGKNNSTIENISSISACNLYEYDKNMNPIKLEDKYAKIEHLHNKEDVGLSNVDNKSSETIRNEITKENIINALEYTPLDSQLKGNKGGVAELDENGKVLSSQLPSYVDDVVEGYLQNNNFYVNDNIITPESGKIYIDINTNKSYRWSGTKFIPIMDSIILGETSSTAYRGDRGKIAYEHSQLLHAPNNAQKNVQSDWNVTDTNSDSYINNKPNLIINGEGKVTVDYAEYSWDSNKLNGKTPDKYVTNRVYHSASDLNNPSFDKAYITITTDTSVIPNEDDGVYNYWHIINFPYENGYCSQLAIPFGTNKMYIRTASNNTWNNWIKVSDNGNADTVDNKHANDFIFRKPITINSIDEIQTNENGIYLVPYTLKQDFMPYSDYPWIIFAMGDTYYNINLLAFNNWGIRDVFVNRLVNNEEGIHLAGDWEKINDGGNAYTLNGKSVDDLQNYNNLTNRPTSMKNPNALTISFNGTSQGSYDGSSTKSINITPSSIGAATAIQGTKADNALPASSYTASDILTKLTTVDGTGSGLDADTLDGKHASELQNYNNLTNKPTSLPANGGNATTANALVTARQIALTGDVTGSVSFNGASNVSLSTTLKNSGVSAGNYGTYLNGICWISNNTSINSSTATMTWTAKQANTLYFSYMCNSEGNYDKFTIKVGDTIIVNAISGFYKGGFFEKSLSAGDVVTFTYVKDGSNNYYGDFAGIGSVYYGKAAVNTKNLSSYFTVTNGTYTFVPKIVFSTEDFSVDTQGRLTKVNKHMPLVYSFEEFIKYMGNFAISGDNLYYDWNTMTQNGMYLMSNGTGYPSGYNSDTYNLGFLIVSGDGTYVNQLCILSHSDTAISKILSRSTLDGGNTWSDWYETNNASNISSGTLNSDRLPTVPVSKGGTGKTTLTSGYALIGNGTSSVNLRNISTTSGGTSGSTDLITSGAVYSGLSTKLSTTGGTVSGALTINGVVEINSELNLNGTLYVEDVTASIGFYGNGNGLTNVNASYLKAPSPGGYNTNIYGNFVHNRTGNSSDCFNICDSNSNNKISMYFETGNLTATGTITANGFSGNATSATKLQTTRALTIGNTGKTFDGTSNVSWTLNEIGAAPYKRNPVNDYNNAYTPGIYMMDSVDTNSPNGNSYNGLIVLKSDESSNASYTEQIAFKEGSTNVYVRASSGSSWLNWQKILTTPDLSDHISSFANDTATGSKYCQINFNNAILKLMYGKILIGSGSYSSTIAFPTAFAGVPMVFISEQFTGNISPEGNTYIRSVTANNFVVQPRTTDSMYNIDEVNYYLNWFAIGL